MIENGALQDCSERYIALGAHSTGGDKQCRKVDYKYMYFTEYLITRADVNDFMAHRPEYTKANRFEDFVCKIYL